VSVRRHPDASAAASLALLPFLVFAAALVPGAVLSPADFVLTYPPWSATAPGLRPANNLLVDVAILFHPALLYAAAELRAGRLPVWNPHEFTGVPFFANPQSGLLFPANWVVFALPPAVGLTLAAILKVSIAGLAMYGFLRALGLRPMSALVGGLAWELNGMLIAWLGWSASSALAVLPLLFLGIERLRRRPDARGIGVLALSVALILVAGYPQIALQGALAAFVWMLARARGAPRGYVVRCVAGAALGAALAAMQVLPFAEYTRESSVYYYRGLWLPDLSPPLRTALAFLIPYYFGRSGTPAFWGYWNFNEISTAVGLVPWAALPVALTAGWRRDGTRVLAALAVFGAVMFYGAPRIAGAIAAIPVLSLVIPHRAGALMVFALCVLGAIGVDAAVTAPEPERHRARRAVKVAFVLVVGVAFAALVVDWSTHVRVGASGAAAGWYGALLVLFTAAALVVVRVLDGGDAATSVAALALIELASLVPVAVLHNPVIDAASLYPRTPAIAFLEGQTARDGRRVALPLPNIAKLYGLSEVAGYDGMTPRRIEQLVSPDADLGLLASGGLTVTVPYGSPVYDLLGIGHVALGPRAAPPAGHFTLEYDGVDARVFANPRALPRAFVVGAARCLPDDAALHALRDGAIDARREVVLADCTAAPASRAIATAEATVTRALPDAVAIDVRTDAAGWLVLTDTYFPGWQATVDGQPRAIARADHAFRAVEVPAGRSRVEFRYRPRALRAGIAVTLAAAGVTIALLLGAHRVRRARLVARGAVLLAAAALANEACAADAAPRPAPVTVTVTPATWTEGEPASLALAPSPASAAPELGDVYVVRVPPGLVVRRYLTPADVWGRTPVPYQRGVALPSTIRAAWTEEGPLGWSFVIVSFVRPGADPRQRANWLWRPVILTVRSRGAPSAVGASAVPILGALGVVTVVAAVVVCRARGRAAPGRVCA
jgi:hypothetical protein